jgi:hypothetical protein
LASSVLFADNVGALGARFAGLATDSDFCCRGTCGNGFFLDTDSLDVLFSSIKSVICYGSWCSSQANLKEKVSKKKSALQRSYCSQPVHITTTYHLLLDIIENSKDYCIKDARRRDRDPANDFSGCKYFFINPPA